MTNINRLTAIKMLTKIKINEDKSLMMTENVSMQNS